MPEEVESAGSAQAESLAPSVPEPPSMSLTSRLLGIGWQWDADGRPVLWLKGSAWRSHGEQHGSRVTGVRLEAGSRVVQATLRNYRDPSVNDDSRSPVEDRSVAAFLATFDPIELLTDDQRRPDDESVFQTTWKALITVEDEYGEVTRRFQTRDDSASPGHLESCDIGVGCLARPEWDGKAGLRVIVARRAYVTESLGFTTPTAGSGEETQFQAVVVARGDSRPETAFLKRGKENLPMTLTALQGRSALQGRRYRVAAPVGTLPDRIASGATGLWYVHLAGPDGSSRHAHWQGAVALGHVERCDADPRIAVRYSPNGVIRLDVQHRRLLVEDVSVTDLDGNDVDRERRVDDLVEPGGVPADHEVRQEPAGTVDQPYRDRRLMIISGEQLGLPDEPGRWVLTGGRQDLPAHHLELADGHFRVSFELDAVPAWGSAVRPLPSAVLRLAVLPDETAAVDAVTEPLTAGIHPLFSGSLTRTVSTPGHRIVIGRNSNGSLRIELGPPRPTAELSAVNRRRLETRHRVQPIHPRPAVLYECFDGKSAGDNTRPIHDELLRRCPDLERIWVVADLSVEVPEGSRRVLRYSPTWWDALSSSRLFVTNCWTPRMYRRRDHQRMMQTWHGTPLKLLGFNRIGTKRGEEYARRTRAEVNQWNFFLSQNPYSSSIFRSAYGYDGRMLESGYPRNDVLLRAGDEDRLQIRNRLGIRPDELVILYVPTWREGAKGLFQELDFGAVSTALGDQGRLLIRGHANTLGYGSNLSGPGIIDVTQYPELSDLYLIADAMITDYSSAMFDFSITGKPMIFFVPDLEQYSSRRRGTYFDLAAEAPGPILRRTDEVIDAITDLDQLRPGFAKHYRAWQRKFNPYDDGLAAQRAVDALLDGFDLST